MSVGKRDQVQLSARARYKKVSPCTVLVGGRSLAGFRPHSQASATAPARGSLDISSLLVYVVIYHAGLCPFADPHLGANANIRNDMYLYNSDIYVYDIMLA